MNCQNMHRRVRDDRKVLFDKQVANGLSSQKKFLSALDLNPQYFIVVSPLFITPSHKQTLLKIIFITNET